MSKKYVYNFGNGEAEGDQSLKELLGGKGANLGEMSAIGLPVPPGFTITTEACKHYNENRKEWPEPLEKQVQENIRILEKRMDAQMGDPKNPLLVSVRSGAAISMPGMMDTVLNLGINDDVVEGLAEQTGNERFAYDTYRRFIDMFGDVVMDVSHEYFDDVLAQLKSERGVELDTELNADDLKDVVDRYKAVYRKHTGFMFPDDPVEQLTFAINGVFNSWSADRAIKYRKINKITGLLGTAVNVQAMVYGNTGEKSATGVCFTRNPSNGKKELYGEFLVNAQGEDVVAGIRTPKPIKEMKNIFPDTYDEIVEQTTKLEEHYKNMQDIEFTMQDGTLYILQTRNGKRTGPAALKIAVDFVSEELASKEKAISDLVDPGHIDQLLHPQIDEQDKDKEDLIGTGLSASPGAAVGKVVFSADEAEAMHENGEHVIMVRVETSPEDVGGMSASDGILTSRGGITSHAAVVARGWGKPCVAGCNDIVINHKKRSFTNGQLTIKKGDWITIDGTTGRVYDGKKQLIEPKFDEYFHTFMGWVDEIRDMKVRTNADTPEDAKKALYFGAEGIGLTRTEHMFFGENRINAIRRMILSESEYEREKALNDLLPYQKSDFKGILEAMADKPVTIRLLDPPLHEFLPDGYEEIRHTADVLGLRENKVRSAINRLKEINPMLGHRGCRLGITYPEITRMQVRAILEAAVELKKEGVHVLPEIMIPLVGKVEEFTDQRDVVKQTAEIVFEEMDERVDYHIGTMIEIPRAALTADRIAKEADFFSFGTNDLTQMTFGYSRDDAGKFMPVYRDKKILEDDPFMTLDRDGVGQLVKIATQKARSVKPDIKLGICGEHGGNPDSIRFCYEQDLQYVSCSPFRVPIARLSAAKAKLENRKNSE
mgnify:FL=1